MVPAGELLKDWRVFPLELKDTALIPFPPQVQPHPNAQSTPTFYRWGLLDSVPEPLPLGLTLGVDTDTFLTVWGLNTPPPKLTRAVPMYLYQGPKTIVLGHCSM